MYSHYAFVSEAGNYEFDVDKGEVTKYFVVTAVLIEDKNLAHVLNEVDEVRSKYLQLGEVNSNQLETDKLLNVINELLNIEFQIYSIVINKHNLLTEGGLGYEKSFFKYVNNLLYNDLLESYTDMLIHADSECSALMKEFEGYIKEHHTPDLFDRSVFEFKKRSETLLIQLADFIGDMILGKFEKCQGVYNDLLEDLSNKIIRIETWPISDFDTYFARLDDNLNRQYDQVIAKKAVQLAERYIKEHQKSKIQVTKDRIVFLKFLRTQLTMGRNKYIYSQEIIDNMKTFSPEIINREYLMSDIIGPLRDAGLLIASTTNGYKLPTSTKDLIDYADFSSSMIIPMLRRLDKARNKILMTTNNELDILAGEDFEEIKGFFDVRYGVED